MGCLSSFVQARIAAYVGRGDRVVPVRSAEVLPLSIG